MVMNTDYLIILYTFVLATISTTCYEAKTRITRQQGDSWSRHVNGRLLTCTCAVEGDTGVISCSDDGNYGYSIEHLCWYLNYFLDRCYRDGNTYTRGQRFTSGEISGVPASCVCDGGGLVSCSATGYL